MQYTSVRLEASNLDAIYEQYKDSIIIGIAPHYNLQEDKGECHAVLIYKKHSKHLVKECSGIQSPHKCAILGMQHVASQVKIAKPIVLLVTSHFGLKKALKNKGKNRDELQEFINILKEKGCPSVTEIFIENGKQKLNKLCAPEK